MQASHSLRRLAQAVYYEVIHDDQLLVFCAALPLSTRIGELRA